MWYLIISIPDLCTLIFFGAVPIMAPSDGEIFQGASPIYSPLDLRILKNDILTSRHKPVSSLQKSAVAKNQTGA